MTRITWLFSIFALVCAGCEEHGVTVRREVESPPPAEKPHGEALPAFHGNVDPGQVEAPSGPVVDLRTVKLTAPEGWIRKPPRSGFVRAEFSLPRAAGDPADGRLTVTVAGGSIADNIERWRQQFGGKPEKEAQDKIKVAQIEVALVDFSGTYLDQGAMMGPGTELPGYRMLGAIFDLGGELYFIKAYGPAKTMAAQADKFRNFVRSLKAVGVESPKPVQKAPPPTAKPAGASPQPASPAAAKAAAK